MCDILLKTYPHAKVLFIDEKGLPEEKIFDFPVVNAAPNKRGAAFIAIGDNKKREALWHALPNEEWMTIISPTAHLGRFSEISKGVFIGNLAHIGPEAKIGPNTIINTGSIIEHEVHVGAHAHICPSATVAGRCRIGDRVFIGVGATVKDSIHIASDIIVGAGAVVVKDLTEPGVYVGVPAQLLNSHQRSSMK